jgi:hypothetical protein
MAACFVLGASQSASQTLTISFSGVASSIYNPNNFFGFGNNVTSADFVST